MWDKVKQTFRSFMSGRYGIDQLSNALVWGGLVLLVLDLLLGTGIFSLLGTGVYVWAIFRMMSRNVEKRGDENRRYVAFMDRIKKRFRQARTRFSNRKEYKYFKCPQCHSWIRMKRNTGTATVTCRNCQHSFEQKA